MTVDVRVNEVQLEAMKKRLGDARTGMQKDSVLMRQIAIYLDSWVQRNFQSQGGNVGNWQPYLYGGRLTTKAKSTSKSQGRYINSTAKLLQDTGVLRHSFLPFIRKSVAGIGSDLPYSKTHEDGLNGIPQRRMLPKSGDVEDRISAITEQFVRVSIGGTK